MITAIEKPSDYRYFLLGIVFFALFEIIWWSISPVFFALEGLMHPIPVVIVENLLKLVAFYYIFRKTTVWDIQWKHLIIVVALYAAVQLLGYLTLFTDFFDNHYLMTDYDIDRKSVV